MVQMEVMGLTSYLQQTPGFVVYLTILFLFFFWDISAYVFGFVAFSSIMFIITIDLGK